MSYSNELIKVTCIKDYFGTFFKNREYFMIDNKHDYRLQGEIAPLNPYSISYDYSPHDDFSHFINFSEEDLLEHFEGGSVILNLQRKKKLQNLG